MKIQFFFTCLFLIAASVQAEMATISGNNVNLRKGPGKNYAAEWKLGKGFPVKIIKKQNSWVQIEDFEGETGWVFKNLLKKNPRVIVNIYKKSSKTVNIRKNASDNSKIIGQASYGVIFDKQGLEGEWIKIKHDTGIQGWIKKDQVWGY